MKDSKGLINIEQFNDIIDILNPCMDNYLYIMDIQNDYYSISESAVERFKIPAPQFSHANDMFHKFVHPDDIPMLSDDLDQIMSELKEEHNLQYRWLDKNYNPIWINCRGRVIFEENMPKYLVGCINEIGRTQKADNDTGLLKESSLQHELESESSKKLSGFLLRLGIDNFKEINENRGIEYGDMILKKTAECIQAVTLPDQKTYKLIADEFLIVDMTGRSVEKAQMQYELIRQNIQHFIESNSYDAFYTISGGIISLDDISEQTFSNLMKLSEFALSVAKRGQKNTCYSYVNDDYRAFLRRKSLINTLRHSVHHNFQGFITYYQPIMNIKEQRLTGAETLLRFYSEETGMVSPVEFIPLLEETGLIIPVGKWVISQAMSACKELQKTIPDFTVSINISYIQVLKSNVLNDILKGLKKYHLAPTSIQIELTESGLLESDKSFINFRTGLHDNGIPLSLDDFGTGYSNFHYLNTLNPRTIKIDRSFTLKALDNDYDYNLLHHMADITRDINSKLCIEGIETLQELNKICRMEPDYIQGYYFGKPCPLDQFIEDFVTNK